MTKLENKFTYTVLPNNRRISNDCHKNSKTLIANSETQTILTKLKRFLLQVMLQINKHVFYAHSNG